MARRTRICFHESADFDQDLVRRVKRELDLSGADIYQLEDDVWVIESDRHGLTLVLFDENTASVSIKNIGKVDRLKSGRDGAVVCNNISDVEWELNL